MRKPLKIRMASLTSSFSSLSLCTSHCMEFVDRRVFCESHLETVSEVSVVARLPKRARRPASATALSFSFSCWFSVLCLFNSRRVNSPSSRARASLLSAVSRLSLNLDSIAAAASRSWTTCSASSSWAAWAEWRSARSSAFSLLMSSSSFLNFLMMAFGSSSHSDNATETESAVPTLRISSRSPKKAPRTGLSVEVTFLKFAVSDSSSSTCFCNSFTFRRFPSCFNFESSSCTANAFFSVLYSVIFLDKAFTCDVIAVIFSSAWAFSCRSEINFWLSSKISFSCDSKVSCHPSLDCLCRMSSNSSSSRTSLLPSDSEEHFLMSVFRVASASAWVKSSFWLRIAFASDSMALTLSKRSAFSRKA
mmetsp:Transcript_134705/g.336122  ORF Transcript_134705/g.336122 Transcript_134705/m.336122 type:complete len:363 (+) Transcript_134705:1402-2490(+)